MDKEKIKKAKNVCRYYLMICSKKTLVDFLLEIFETHFPETIVMIAKRLKEEIPI